MDNNIIYGVYSIIVLLSLQKVTSTTESTPTIKNCIYTDAHWVECTWLENEFVNEKYRMAFLRDSDPADKRSFHLCTDTEPKHKIQQTSNQSVIKSCAFPAHMFATYEIYMVEQSCQDGDISCPNVSKLLFEASPDFVYLTSPSTDLEIDHGTMILSWKGPDRHGSMLRFALFERHVKYIVQFRETQSQVWNNLYEGYQNHVSLPPLKSGTGYEIKLTSVLDAPNGDFLHEENIHGWGAPESFMNFTTQIANSSTIDTESEVAVNGSTKHIANDELNQHTIATVVVGGVLLLAMLILVPILYCCKCFTCDERNKTAKPFLRVEFRKQLATPKQNYGSTDAENDPENYAPISRLLQAEPISNLRADMFMTKNEHEQEFFQRSDHTKVFFEPRSKQGESEKNILKRSMSLDDDTSDSVSMAYLKQMPHLHQLPRESASSSSYCQNGKSVPSECSLPSYILGPCDIEFVYNNSVSSYVTGSEFDGSKILIPRAKNDLPKHSSFGDLILGHRNNNQKVFNDNNPQVVHLVHCAACNNKKPIVGEHVVNCPFIDPPELSRRNSYSDHSVDSGYSPDNLDTTVKNF